MTERHWETLRGHKLSLAGRHDTRHNSLNWSSSLQSANLWNCLIFQLIWKVETCPDTDTVWLVYCKSGKASGCWISYPNLLRSCACAESDMAVEDPLINLIISLLVLILGWKYSAQDHIFNWQWSQGSAWSDSAEDNWLNFGIKANTSCSSVEKWKIFE